MPLPSDEKLLELSDKILAQFDAIFGLHPGFRPAHAKGAMLSGTFTPADGATSLTKAPHAARAATPVTVRFSNSTGIPLLSDLDPNADPRGMAIRFHLAERSHTDIIAHATDGFPARNGDEFLGLLQAIATSDPKKAPDPADPSPVEKFLGTHPAALAFVQTPKPTPASFATEAFFGVTAMEFFNAAGVSQFGRYQIAPVAGVQHLDAATAKTQSEHFLFDELAERIKTGPIEFKVNVQLADVGDVVDDATIHWPADRRVLELGTITLDSAVDNDAAEQKHLIFDPIPRVEGIEPSNDPLLELRAAIYLISGRRRRKA